MDHISLWPLRLRESIHVRACPRKFPTVQRIQSAYLTPVNCAYRSAVVKLDLPASLVSVGWVQIAEKPYEREARHRTGIEFETRMLTASAALGAPAASAPSVSQLSIRQAMLLTPQPCPF